jgi:TolB protein
MQKLTGRSGFFQSELAFVRKTQKDKDIYACTPQGRSLRPVVDLDGYCLSPAWSADGRQVGMSFVGQDKHEFVVFDTQNGDVRRTTLPGNTIISPTFWPGNGWVISADPRKSPDIFKLTADLSLGEPLVQHWAIDISPHFDAQGTAMVFVSSRFGNPHIFLRHMDSGEIERISFEGTYNTNPSISPDGRFVAYSRLIKGHGHRIIVYDRQKGSERQVSFGPGNDEDPAWGPDSYFLAFSSDRSGTYQLYVTTRHAEEPKKIPTGEGAATSPAWKPNKPQ